LTNGVTGTRPVYLPSDLMSAWLSVYRSAASMVGFISLLF